MSNVLKIFKIISIYFCYQNFSNSFLVNSTEEGIGDKNKERLLYSVSRYYVTRMRPMLNFYPHRDTKALNRIKDPRAWKRLKEIN